MDLDQFIEICDGLEFLCRISLKYYEDVAIPESVVYEMKTDPAFHITYYRGLGPEFVRAKQHFFGGPFISFEEFFEEISDEGRVNIVFHLDLFR